MCTVRDGTNGICGHWYVFAGVDGGPGGSGCSPRLTQLDDRLADRFDAQTSCGQHVGRDAALLAQQPEQQVLGAYVLVRQPVGFFGRVLERPLAGSAEWDFVGLRDFLAAVRRRTMSLRKSSRATTGSREDPATKPLASFSTPRRMCSGSTALDPSWRTSERA